MSGIWKRDKGVSQFVGDQALFSQNNTFHKRLTLLFEFVGVVIHCYPLWAYINPMLSILLCSSFCHRRSAPRTLLFCSGSSSLPLPSHDLVSLRASHHSSVFYDLEHLSLSLAANLHLYIEPFTFAVSSCNSLFLSLFRSLFSCLLPQHVVTQASLFKTAKMPLL